MQKYKNEISFIHTADLHLGSPFSGISEKDRGLADYLSRSIFQSFDNIINLCISKQVDLLLIAGDIFDSKEKNLQAIHHLIRGLERLKEIEIPVIITTGNHDPLQDTSSRTTIWDTIIRISGDNPPFILIQSDSCEQIDIQKSGDVIAKVCGVSFRTPEITYNPVQDFPERADNTVPWIGLVHCTIGSHSDHIPYAPLTLSDLTKYPYDYWALGHIHAGYTVRESGPAIIYPGNIQGRNWRETGPRGCILTTIRTDGTVHTEFCETAPVRFETRELSITGMEQEDELLSALDNLMQEVKTSQKERSTIVLIYLTGSGLLHQILIKTSLIEDIMQRWQEYNPSPPFCYLASVTDSTTPIIDREALRGTGDIFDVICTGAEELVQEPDLTKTRTMLAPLFSHNTLKHLLTDISDDELRVLVRKAEEHLLIHLGAADED